MNDEYIDIGQLKPKKKLTNPDELVQEQKSFPQDEDENINESFIIFFLHILKENLDPKDQKP